MEVIQTTVEEMFWIVVILSLFSVINCVIIGQIGNHIMIGISSNLLLNQTKDQCICQMIKSNQSLFALNYFQTNQTCQFFNYNNNSILIQFYFNSSFIFINQSSILNTNMITSSANPTSTTPSISSNLTTPITSNYTNTTYSYTENSMINLTCTNSMKLQIVNAFYGAPHCINCNCSYCVCTNMNVTATIVTQCANLSSCIFTANNGLFNDPCPNHLKTFTVAYYCS